jgi:hypothetical protein
MATKADFTPEEWSVVRDAPYLTAMAMTVAGASGLVGTLKEAVAASSSLVEGMRSDSELVRSVCTRDEMQAAQASVRSMTEPMKGADLATVKSKVQSLATEKVHAAIGLLSRKGAQDVAGYGIFVKGIGQRVAEAASEGGFLGFGGERVSEGERQMLAALERALSPS